MLEVVKRVQFKQFIPDTIIVDVWANAYSVALFQDAGS